MAPRLLTLLMSVLVGCHDSTAPLTAGDPSSASGATSGAPEPVSTGDMPTSDMPATTKGSTEEGPMSGGSSTGSSSNVGESSGSTTGGPSSCGPPCAETWELQGTLDLDETDDLSQYACLTRVGELNLQGDIPPESLAVFANLREVVGYLRFTSMPGLEDLSAFGCLQQVDALMITDMPELNDLEGLGALTQVTELTVSGTGVVALPAFAPGFGGLAVLRLEGNSALSDISALASWGTSEKFVTIRLIDDAALTSVAPLADVLARPVTGGLKVQLTNLPALESLAGLDPVTVVSQPMLRLHLGDLPLVSDLQPLAGLVSIEELRVMGMPGVTSLAALSTLETATGLYFGDCFDEDPYDEGGMDGLMSLAGLDSLVEVRSLGVTDSAQITSLDGAPLLKHVEDLVVLADPGLSQAAIDEFIAQLDETPFLCIGDWGDCWCT